VTGGPKIRPLAPGERDAETEELLYTVGPDLAELNIFSTLVRHPRFYKRWTKYGAVLLFGSLPPRDRELLILRTAHHTRCSYEWRHHDEIARARGLTPEEVAAVREGPEWPRWSAWDATLLQAADELHRDARLSDATWSVLAERYDERLLIEVPMLVGHYHSVAFTVNSLGIELEEAYRGES
jgi:AhpD family alkylhydroperoxidase